MAFFLLVGETVNQSQLCIKSIGEVEDRNSERGDNDIDTAAQDGVRLLGAKKQQLHESSFTATDWLEQRKVLGNINPNLVYENF